MLEHFRSRMGKSEFARGVVVLMSGTVIAQLLPILIAPVLSRLFTPEQFATFGLFTAMVNILGVISTGKYEFAIPLPKTAGDGISIAFFSASLVAIVGILLSVVILIFHNTIVIALGDPNLAGWLYVLPAGVVLTGLYQVANFWANRNKDYGALSRAKISRAVATTGLNSGMGWAGIHFTWFSQIGLIASTLIGQILEIAMLLPAGDLYAKRHQYWRLVRSRMFGLAVRYKSFPRYDVPSELMITASVQMPVLLFTRLFDRTTTGFYFYSHRVLSLPLSLIGSSIAQVLYGQLASVRHDVRQSQQLVGKTYEQLVLLGALAFSVVGFFGPELFSIVFGSAWRQAGVFASMISPWLMFNFVGSPLTIIFSVYEKQRHMFFWMLFMFLSRICALWLGYSVYRDANASVMLYSLGGAAFYFGMNTYLVWHIVGIPLRQFLRMTFVKPSLILGAIWLIRYLVDLTLN